MHPANQQFIEKMGLFFEADGAPRISGRILGLLLLTPGDCSLDDLADELQVSKASVSTNARLLESWGAVERTSRPGDRRDYYRIADDVEARMLERRLERMRSMRGLIEEGRRTGGNQGRRGTCPTAAAGRVSRQLHCGGGRRIGSVARQAGARGVHRRQVSS